MRSIVTGAKPVQASRALSLYVGPTGRVSQLALTGRLMEHSWVDAVGDDLFVSYTSADRAWVEWIGWQLKKAGLSVVLQAWDMLPGRDFVHEMQRATTMAGRTIAVMSPACLSSEFGEAEWRVAFANDPSGKSGC